MGSQITVMIENGTLAGRKVLEQVPQWFEDWEQCLSRFRPDSDLSMLNASPEFPVVVNDVLWDVLQAARTAERRSGGIVTPVVLTALEHAGYDRSFEDLLLATQRTENKDGNMLPSFQSVFFDPTLKAVMLPKGMRLDFGGIGKGWAAQAAAKRLSQLGPALVDAGGDIAIGAAPLEMERWPVGVSDPYNPTMDAALLGIERGGIATSGKDYRRWQQRGAWQHHIIDPRTGLPAVSDVFSATVIAPDVMQAEMAAKSVLILGSRAGLAWLDQQPGMEALLFLENRQMIETANFDSYRWRRDG